MDILSKMLNSQVVLDAAAGTESNVGNYGLFELTPQLIFDACILALNIFLLFILLSYLLFNPVRNVLKKRQEKISSDRETAEKDKEDALLLKAEYEERLKAVDKEIEAMMGEARKKALKNEEHIIAEAKEEAARIIERAKVEAELEKNKAADQIKQEIIGVATVMAGKLVAVSLDEATQNKLIDETLGEMGEGTWQN